MPARAHLFTPLELRDVTLRNRIAMSPMCQYSARDGFPTDWHRTHLVSRAVGGVGMVVIEATAVEARGRITPFDLGIWSDSQGSALAPIASAIARHGAVPAIQLAHAGRKASAARPWEGGAQLAPEAGGWKVIAPSALPYSEDHLTPAAMTDEDLERVRNAFVAAARRSLEAGFQAIELHAAHGYLLHEFLSPLSNRREDAYGGSFENRVRLLEEIVRLVRSAWPDEFPLLVRLSTTEWRTDGFGLDDSVRLAKRLAAMGVDLIDASSSGNARGAQIPVGPGFQTPLAARIRADAGIATAAVGLITEPVQADHVVRTGQADLVMLGRALLRDPYWALRAARELGHEAPWPPQYLRAGR